MSESSEPSEIQKLLRLKRYELPPEGYVDDFVTEFHQRQRSELLHQSSRSLLMERLDTWFAGMGLQKWIMAAGAAYAVFTLGFFVFGSGGDTQAKVYANGAHQSAVSPAAAGVVPINVSSQANPHLIPASDAGMLDLSQPKIDLWEQGSPVHLRIRLFRISPKSNQQSLPASFDQLQDPALSQPRNSSNEL